MMEERKRPLDASDAMASGGALKRLREDSASGSNGVHDEDDSSPAFKDLEVRFLLLSRCLGFVCLYTSAMVTNGTLGV